jgi:hypothetical protein
VVEPQIANAFEGPGPEQLAIACEGPMSLWGPLNTEQLAYSLWGPLNTEQLAYSLWGPLNTEQLE